MGLTSLDHFQPAGSVTRITATSPNFTTSAFPDPAGRTSSGDSNRRLPAAIADSLPIPVLEAAAYQPVNARSTGLSPFAIVNLTRHDDATWGSTLSPTSVG